MNPRLIEIQQQIDSLKAEAERLRRDEIDGVVARIKEAITAYGLTAEDLGLAGLLPLRRKPGPKPGARAAKAANAAKAAKAAKAAEGALAASTPKATRRKGIKAAGKGKSKSKSNAVPRFRDANGNSWVGIGKRPTWLRDQLAAGKSLQDFAV